MLKEQIVTINDLMLIYPDVRWWEYDIKQTMVDG